MLWGYLHSNFKKRTLATIVELFALLHVTFSISLRLPGIQSHIFEITAGVAFVSKKKCSLYENLYCKLLEENLNANIEEGYLLSS